MGVYKTKQRTVCQAYMTVYSQNVRSSPKPSLLREGLVFYPLVWVVWLVYIVFLLCLSGLNLMEGKLNKEQWQRFPPKPYDAKAK